MGPMPHGYDVTSVHDFHTNSPVVFKYREYRKESMGQCTLKEGWAESL